MHTLAKDGIEKDHPEKCKEPVGVDISVFHVTLLYFLHTFYLTAGARAGARAGASSTLRSSL